MDSAPHPTPEFAFNVTAFPFNVMAFPVIGRLGRRKWRGQGPDPDLMGAPTQRQRHLAMAWRRRRQAMGTPSNWERQVTGNAI